jgi:hypothetical protein
MSKAFAPVLRANGGGALLNGLSVASWINGGELAAYAASKSTAWSLTNALRHELAAQSMRMPGFADSRRAWQPTKKRRALARAAAKGVIETPCLFQLESACCQVCTGDAGGRLHVPAAAQCADQGYRGDGAVAAQLDGAALHGRQVALGVEQVQIA